MKIKNLIDKAGEFGKKIREKVFPGNEGNEGPVSPDLAGTMLTHYDKEELAFKKKYPHLLGSGYPDRGVHLLKQDNIDIENLLPDAVNLLNDCLHQRVEGGGALASSSHDIKNIVAIITSIDPDFFTNNTSEQVGTIKISIQKIAEEKCNPEGKNWAGQIIQGGHGSSYFSNILERERDIYRPVFGNEMISDDAMIGLLREGNKKSEIRIGGFAGISNSHEKHYRPLLQKKICNLCLEVDSIYYSNLHPHIAILQQYIDQDENS